jgi:RNA polymerase-binding transcription factor DksA
MRYHYLTLEQRSALQQLICSETAAGPRRDEALARLHTPDFGVCIECGKDIPFVMLQADIGALHCRACSRLPVRRPD